MALITGTNLTTNALEVDFSSTTVAELRRRVVLGMATDKTWDGAGGSNVAATIRVPDAHTDTVEDTDVDFRTAANRAKLNRAWADGTDITSAHVILTQGREARAISHLGRKDVDQSPIAELDKERNEQVGELARNKEDKLAEYIDGLATTTNVVPAAADYPNPQGTGSNGNGGKVYAETVGTAGTGFIDTSGTPKRNADARIPTNILKKARLTMVRNDYLRGGDITSMGDRNDMVYAFMAPEIAQVLLDDIEESRNFSTTLTENVLGLDDNGPRLNGNNAYEGTYRGIHVMTSTNAVFGGGGRDVPWKIWVLSARAIASTDGEVLTQILTPQNNQNGPVYTIRQVQEYGFQLVQRAALLKFDIRQK